LPQAIKQVLNALDPIHSSSRRWIHHDRMRPRQLPDAERHLHGRVVRTANRSQRRFYHADLMKAYFEPAENVARRWLTRSRPRRFVLRVAQPSHRGRPGSRPVVPVITGWNSTFTRPDPTSSGRSPRFSPVTAGVSMSGSCQRRQEYALDGAFVRSNHSRPTIVSVTAPRDALLIRAWLDLPETSRLRWSAPPHRRRLILRG